MRGEVAPLSLLWSAGVQPPSYTPRDDRTDECVTKSFLLELSAYIVNLIALVPTHVKNSLHGFLGSGPGLSKSVGPIHQPALSRRTEGI